MAGTRHIQSYLTQFNQRGYPTSVLALGASKDPSDPEDGTFEGTPYRAIAPNLLLKSADRKQYRRGLEFMRTQLREECSNVVVHYGVPDPRNVPYLRKIRSSGYRLVHWIVEDYSVYSLRWARQHGMFIRALSLRWLDRLVPRLSDGVIVLSRRLEQKYSQRVKSIRRIPISIQRPVHRYERLPPGGSLRITYVGTFGYKDGVEDLIRAYLAYRQAGGGGRLVLVGGGVGAKAFRAQYESHEGIEFTGYVPDAELERQLQIADVLCMTRVDDPYAHAGFPYKLGEYLSTGNPVVATRVGDIEEYLHDGESAVIVPPGDHSAIARALFDLERNQEQARRIGQAGLSSFEKNFASEVNASRWLDYIVEILPA